MSFTNLQLTEPVLRALINEKHTSPTPIQEKAIPVILQKKDFVGIAQTGTGKTAAFVLPLLQLLQAEKSNEHSARTTVLILSPTRELAIQIGESISAYGRYLPIRHAVIYGGVAQSVQIRAIRDRVDILVATPGRLMDLVNQRLLSLQHIRFFVLDEADRMLDMGFIQDVRRIVAKLPARRQNLFFSATMSPAIQQLAGGLLVNPVRAEVAPVSSTAEKIEQSVYFVEKEDKLSLLIDLLKAKNADSILVFTQMKHAADKLCRSLVKAGIRSEAIHGNKSQLQRQAALSNFRSGKTRVLVATDIAARGIDIDNLTMVINYELPNIPETYVHRIGRTGRAGKEGCAVSFCDWSEKVFLRDIQKLIGKTIPVVKGHAFDRPVMHEAPATAKAAAGSVVIRKKGRSRAFMQRY